MSSRARLTDEELAAWVPKNHMPPEDTARAAGISSRVMAVILAIREQYDRDGAKLIEFDDVEAAREVEAV